MSKQEIIKIFGDRKIRSVWDDEAEIWYFSIVDVVAVLTGSVKSAAMLDGMHDHIDVLFFVDIEGRHSPSRFWFRRFFFHIQDFVVFVQHHYTCSL